MTEISDKDAQDLVEGRPKWVLVPADPTAAMVKAAAESPQMETITGVLSLHQARGYSVNGLGASWDTSALAEAYRAMIGAAPRFEGFGHRSASEDHAAFLAGMKPEEGG